MCVYSTHTTTTQHACHGRHPPWPLPPPMAVCRPFRYMAHACHIMSDALCACFFVSRGEVSSVAFCTMRVKSIFFPALMTSAATSAAAHCCLLPNPAQRASSEHCGRRRARVICFHLRCGGCFGRRNATHRKIERGLGPRL